MQVRTGKTLTSIATCENLAIKMGRILNVLFVTKKKALPGIQKDIDAYGSPHLDVNCINYDSMSKMPVSRYNVLILDEAHALGAFPKPSNRAKLVADLIYRYKYYVILMSGTPTPESYSQIYHQIYGIPGNPMARFRNFYQFAHAYVDVRTKKINGFDIKDYSRASEAVIQMMQPYTISYTQEEAGFDTKIEEHVLHVSAPAEIWDIIHKLKVHKVCELPEGAILADSGVKLMSKMHQLCGGTVLTEDAKDGLVISTYKAEFIAKRFAGMKIGIFYKFRKEYDVLKAVFKDKLTDSLAEFESTDKHIALQIVSGREGISLRHADALVYYNIDFSATSYWQSRDRMTTLERMHNHVYWVFTAGGIEDKVYAAVTKKKDYTLYHFNKDVNLLFNDGATDTIEAY